MFPLAAPVVAPCVGRADIVTRSSFSVQHVAITKARNPCTAVRRLSAGGRRRLSLKGFLKCPPFPVDCGVGRARPQALNISVPGHIGRQATWEQRLVTVGSALGIWAKMECCIELTWLRKDTFPSGSRARSDCICCFFSVTTSRATKATRGAA